MKINNISNIIAIGSVKGGVGKSTITANIAIFLNKKNKRIGILDADIYGPSQEKILGLKKLSIYKNNNIIPAEANNIKIVSINSLIKKNEVLLIKAPIINKLTKILTNNVYWNTLDYLLIDLPPGTGDIHINIMQNLPIDSAIIISSPQKMSFNIAKKSIYMFNSLNIPIIGFIENFSFFSCYNCKKKNNISNISIEKKLIKYNLKLIEKIPIFEEISQNNLTSKIYKNTNLINIFNKITKIIINYSKNNNTYFYVLYNGIFFIIINNIKNIINTYELRLLCKCIKCVKIKSKSLLLFTSKISKKIYIKKINKIGNYAIKIYFSDNHISEILNNKTIKYC